MKFVAHQITMTEHQTIYHERRLSGSVDPDGIGPIQVLLPDRPNMSFNLEKST